MEFLICEKHKKTEKVVSKVNTNGYVCMNRYCPDSFKIFCSNCKNDHRDHAIKVLTLQDTTFLIQRLLKHPFKQPNRYLVQALDVMKKLKLIKQFRKKIDILQKQIQKEALRLIDSTESLNYEYGMCKQGVQKLSTILSSIEKHESYQQFFQNSQSLLSNLDYNFKKDKMEYGNGLTKEKEDKRRKTLESAKRKIEEVRDYSMKIIEVILHTSQSDDDEEDINYQKKHYELLRKQLSLEKDEHELEEEISELKGSKSTSNKSRFKKNLLDCQSQTSQTTVSVEDIKAQYQIKIKQLQEDYKRAQVELRQKLSMISTEKENLSKELNGLKQKYDEKRKNIKQLEVSLRDNRIKRLTKQKSREEVVDKIIDLWQWKGLHSDDKHD